jgi:hypothetical protein
MQHSIKHLQSVDGEAWLGLVDGVHAVSITLIAVELPELVWHITELPNDLMDNLMTTRVLVHFFVSYFATFLLFYEIWTIHKSILKLGGLKIQSQNLLNGMIMALTCLAAGNVILIIKSRQKVDAEVLEGVSDANQLFLRWTESHWYIWVTIFLIIAIIFQMMASFSRLNANCNELNKVKLIQLSRNLSFKARLILLGLLIWAPMLFGYKVFIEPLFMYLAFLVVCFFEEPILSWWKRRGTHA